MLRCVCSTELAFSSLSGCYIVVVVAAPQNWGGALSSACVAVSPRCPSPPTTCVDPCVTCAPVFPSPPPFTAVAPHCGTRPPRSPWSPDVGGTCLTHLPFSFDSAIRLDALSRPLALWGSRSLSDAQFKPPRSLPLATAVPRCEPH